MDPMVKDLAIGAIIPALVAGAALAAVWAKRLSSSVVSGNSAPTDWRVPVTPLIYGVAVAAGFAAILGVPEFMPTQVRNWLPFIAIAAGLAGAVVSLDRVPAAVRWSVVSAVLLGAGWVSLQSMRSRLTGGQIAAEMFEFAFAGVVSLAAVSVLVRRSRFASIIVLLIVAGATSQLLVLGFASNKIGQVAGMGASVLGPTLLIALWRPNFRLGMGAATFIVTLTLAVLFQGKLYASRDASPEGLMRVYAIVILLSPVLAAIGEVSLPVGMSPRFRALIVIGLAGLPLAAATGYAGKAYFAEKPADGVLEYEYEYGSLPRHPVPVNAVTEAA